MIPKFLYASTKDSDMRYVVGIDISDPFFVLDTGEMQYIFLDHREFGIFEEKNSDSLKKVVLLNPFIDRARRDPEDAPLTCKIALLILKEYGLQRTEIIVPDHFPLFLADYLRGHHVVLLTTDSLYPARAVKTPDQIAMLGESLVRTQHAFERVEEILRDSTIQGEELLYGGLPLTSEFLRSEAERVLLAHDMISTEGLIISCGAHAAIPHHPGQGFIRPRQTIVCDIFPRHRISGYFADMTRTYIKGDPSKAIQKMYDTVVAAQCLALSMVKPGVAFQEIQLAVEKLFLEQGYHVGDQGFVHGLGHGLGLDVHELPFVRKGQQTILEPGNVITIEPGLYYPELGGVRIEDVVVVTEKGTTDLTNYHKNFIIP